MYDDNHDGGIREWEETRFAREDARLLDEHRKWKETFYKMTEEAMAKVNEMVQSKYLKTADVPDPIIVTVQGVKQVNMAKEDEAPELKWAIKFRELDKPMVLNSTNIHVAAKVFKSDDTDDWKGKEIILYTDPNVSFGGQVVGGLRFRGQEKAPVKAPARATAGMEDDIPF